MLDFQDIIYLVWSAFRDEDGENSRKYSNTIKNTFLFYVTWDSTINSYVKLGLNSHIGYI